MINVNELNYVTLCKLTKEKGMKQLFPTTSDMKMYLNKLNDIYVEMNNNELKKIQIVKIQKWWKLLRPNFAISRVTHNSIDPFSMNELYSINKYYHIGIYENAHVYVFDIRYLYEQIVNQQNCTNPFTKTPFTEYEISRIKNKVQQLKQSGIDIDLDEELLTNSQLLIRRYEKLVCKINRLGYTHVNVDWLYLTPDKQLSFYIKLAFIWTTYVSPEFKSEFENDNLFSKMYLLQNINVYNYTLIQDIVLEDLEKIFNLNTHDTSIISQFVIYILISLTEVHEDVIKYYQDIVMF